MSALNGPEPQLGLKFVLSEGQNCSPELRKRAEIPVTDAATTVTDFSLHRYIRCVCVCVCVCVCECVMDRRVSWVGYLSVTQRPAVTLIKKPKVTGGK